MCIEGSNINPHTLKYLSYALSEPYLSGFRVQGLLGASGDLANALGIWISGVILGIWISGVI